MDETALSLIIMLVGLLIVVAILVKAGLERLGVPALVGFLGLGFIIRLLNAQWPIFDGTMAEILSFLAILGVISLLFRVGLESNLKGLIHQLPRASIIWLGNVGLSGILGYITAHILLGLPMIPSLFVAVALTATSIGVSVSIWQDNGAANTPEGELLIDVAEMDDITSIALMALLFAVVPVLQGASTEALFPLVAQASGIFIFKASLFGIVCLLFSLYLEHPLTKFFQRIGSAPDPMLMIAGTGIVIAAFASWLGFSAAIGALFAGLIFSRDPDAVKENVAFSTLYDLLVPFFFIGIGFNIVPDSLVSALGLGLLLTLPAIIGKVVGAGVPAWLTVGSTGGVLIGVSMVPRAEMAMIVIQQGHYLGQWAVPDALFAAMIVVVAITAIFAPLALRPLLQRWLRLRRKRLGTLKPSSQIKSS